ncbi:MAG: hypothetical protein LBH59_11340 [Planctomycetaceae bacterium]|jgi:hypothetical protein|nr:hypothetical protein [Planctomycetaceae bacterium]
MRSIILSFVFVWAISFSIANVVAQSDEVVSDDSVETTPAVVASEGDDDNDFQSALSVAPLQSDNEIANPVIEPNINNTNDAGSSIETNDNQNETSNNQDEVGRAQSWNEWDKQFAPKENNAPVPRGNLPSPPPYNGYINNYNNYNNQNVQSANANINQFENKPIPYLMWHRDPWTHRLNLAPYAPGYAAAPRELLIPPSNFRLWLTNFPNHGYYWQQPQYLGYYDQMPEIVSATPSRSQMILGYPDTPQTQYRDPYTGQPLTSNPAINPESILPVRESLMERWRRRSFERRAVPLGQFPNQPQPNQSPLFGGQPNNQNYQQENSYAQYQQQYQPAVASPRYVRRPLFGRFRQGLRERIQRLGIFEALTQGQNTGYNPNNQPNPNANYDEAPAYDGTN